MAKAHVYCNGVLCGDDGFVSLAGGTSMLCQRCQGRINRFVAGLTQIADTETVGAVDCRWCHKAGGAHHASCPREIAAKALGYKNLVDMGKVA